MGGGGACLIPSRYNSVYGHGGYLDDLDHLNNCLFPNAFEA